MGRVIAVTTCYVVYTEPCILCAAATPNFQMTKNLVLYFLRYVISSEEKFNNLHIWKIFSVLLQLMSIQFLRVTEYFEFDIS